MPKKAQKSPKSGEKSQLSCGCQDKIDQVERWQNTKQKSANNKTVEMIGFTIGPNPSQTQKLDWNS